MTAEPRQTVDDIFHAACDQSPEEREVYLDRVCAGNIELRNEVEELLKHYEAGDTFLEKPVLHEAARQWANEITKADSHTDPQADTLRDGNWQIGPYRILDLVGQGGMGVVYLADDRQHDRQVAIKILPKDFLSDGDRLARFNREARMLEELKHLKHPNIAEIYEQTKYDGRPCLVLEYVPGDSLDERLDNGRLSVTEALQLGLQIADALDSAHRQHIIHRDLKPSNIKITPEGKVKVLDFGLAKRFYPDFTGEEPDEFETRSLSLTESGMLIGTPAYMSPEQWESKEIDQRTDIWAFGCLLYEMLTGLPPFARKSRAETMKAIFDASPDWQALPPGTPIIIQDLLRRCLHPDASQRLQDAAEARRALTEALGKKRFSPSLLVKPLAWGVKRHASAIAVTAVLMICAVVAVWYWKKISAIPEQKYVVVLPFKGFNVPQAGVGFAEDLRKSLANASDDIHVFKSPENSTDLIGNTDLAQTFVGFGVNLILSGEVRFTGDQAAISYQVRNSYRYSIINGRVEGQRSDLPALQDRIARDVVGALKVPLSNRVPGVLQFKSSHSESIDQYLEAIGYLQSDLTKDSIDRPIELLQDLINTEGKSPRYLAALAQAYLYKFTITNEREWASRAFDLCVQAINIDANYPEVQITRGLVLVHLGKYEDAISSLKSALIQRPDDLDAMIGLARAYEDSIRFEEAEKTYLDVIKRWPNFWWGHNELGSFYLMLGKYDQALDEFQLVTTLNRVGPSGYVNLGNAYFEMGRYDNAKESFSKSINVKGTEEAYIGLGTVQFYLEQYRESVDSFRAGIELNNESPILWANLGDAYRQIPGEGEEAIRAYNQAILFRQQFLKPGPVSTARLAELFAKRSTLSMSEKEKTKDIQKARNQILEAVNTDPEDVRVLSVAIIVFHILGERDNAIRFVEQSLKNGLSTSELQNNPELKELRLDPTYQKIISQYQK